jgi:hypothetical protein
MLSSSEAEELATIGRIVIYFNVHTAHSTPSYEAKILATTVCSINNNTCPNPTIYIYKFQFGPTPHFLTDINIHSDT